jgi:hypothetical protein
MTLCLNYICVALYYIRELNRYDFVGYFCALLVECDFCKLYRSSFFVTFGNYLEG